MLISLDNNYLLSSPTLSAMPDRMKPVPVALMVSTGVWGLFYCHGKQEA